LETLKEEISFLILTLYKGERWDKEKIFDLKTYQKPMNKGLYLPFSSFYTKACKKALVTGELRRFVRNSSKYLNYLDTRNLFFKQIHKRGYPMDFIIQ